jgi:hypothetical protein
LVWRRVASSRRAAVDEAGSPFGIQAIDAAAAIRQSIAIWPPKSIGMRILPEGHKVFEQLKADRR